MRQADAQIPAVALKHANATTHHVVQRFVAAAESLRRAGRRVILPVDPVRHQHRRGHQKLEHTAVGVSAGVVIMQKTSPIELHAARPFARRNDEGGVTRQAPLWPRLRAIIGAAAQLFQ